MADQTIDKPATTKPGSHADGPAVAEVTAVSGAHAGLAADASPDSGPGSGPDSGPEAGPESGGTGAAGAKPKRTFMEKLDAWVSELSTKSNFWNRICSMIWLPYAFKSGIQMRRLDGETFTFELPFRRFNKNWYNAMAGAALLGNAEIAGGNYVFSFCGGDYTVVCKHLEYRFLRPCLGPAIYKVRPREDLQALIDAGGEFNITIDMQIVQSPLANLHPKERRKLRKKAERKAETSPEAGEDVMRKAKRVGRANATFHVTPKMHQKAKGRNFRG